MTPDAWIMLAIIAVAAYMLVRETLPPAVTFLGALTATLLLGLNDVEAAFIGFSNEALVTIAALFVIARATSKTGLILPLVQRLLRAKSTPRLRMARFLTPVAALSGFTNNTPIVAMMAPQISRWADKHKQPVSRYLMPLSFATVLGGVLTVIGTSTNVVVSGLMDQTGLEGLGFFELTKVSLPIVIFGLLYLIFFSDKLLPDRRSAATELREDVRQFVIDMEVEPKLHGKTVEAAGLRHLKTVFLVEIERGNELISPVGSKTKLKRGDIVRFAGRVDEVLDLRHISGIKPVAEKHATYEPRESHYFEAVVGTTSPLVGKNLKEADFRGIYQAGVMAIHRSGERINAKPGSVQLRAGDTLLLASDSYFKQRWEGRRDFMLVYQLDAPGSGKSKNSLLLGTILVGAVALAASGLIPLVVAVLFGALAVVATKIITLDEARKAVDIELLIMIAAAFGVAEAVSSTGLAEVLANSLITVLGALGVIGILLGVIVATIIVTELLTNAAAAVLILPIAIVAAQNIGADPRGFAVAVAIAASCSFITPIGYQTNMMVYGPGGYKFTDYARLGLPLTIMVAILLTILVPLFYF